jgi:hypothetical protein
MTEPEPSATDIRAAERHAPVDRAAQPVVPRAVEIHIEELVLRGFPASDRYRIGEAVKDELARLLARGGTPRGPSVSRSAGRLDAGAFRVPAGARARSIGALVAQRVYRQIAPFAGERSRHTRSEPGELGQ